MKKDVLAELKLEYDNTTTKISVSNHGVAFAPEYRLSISNECHAASGLVENTEKVAIAVDKDYLTKIRDMINVALRQMESGT